MLVRIDPGSDRPLAAQIAAGIRGAALRGEVGPGDRLPSARALAESVDVNLHTVLRAYAELRDEGLIDLRRGRGAVIRADFEPAAAALAYAAQKFIEVATTAGLTTADMIALIKENASS